MIKDAENILRVLGLGSYLHIGCGNSTLVFELMKRSVDAYGLDPDANLIAKLKEHGVERYTEGSFAKYPFKPELFDSIIIGPELLAFSDENLKTVWKTLHLMTKRNLVLYFPSNTLAVIPKHQDKSNRLFWEKLAIAAGFRRHPRGMLATPYHELENEKLDTLTFFERVPASALKTFPLTWLLANRDLHMDMLREAGRRSDGHVSRYHLAATMVRPGDVVLDAACGLGYGTAVLSACSPGARFIGVDIDAESIAYATANFADANPALSYQTSDVTQLAFLADHSVDTVISFETIEHVKDYDIFLAELKRVLKPDGRFLGSVPNLWCDETGNDPNPYHFHVFDWNKLNQAVSKYFIVDGRWAQNAGGGFKLREGKREMWHVALNQPEPHDTEWWLISAGMDPSNATTISYTNPFHHDQNNAIPTHVDFAKYYDNPWLYRVMVQLGERLADTHVLSQFCVNTAKKAKLGSADQGAALCVLGYQLLESGNVTLLAVASLIQNINNFDQAYDKNNPHSHRWAISLHYIGARLLLALGNRQDALATFLNCAAMDPVRFSPLLATKTISARMYAGLILVSTNKLDDARIQFHLAIKEAHRVMQGDWSNIVGNLEQPLPFGLQEAAEVLDIASQCAQALHALDRQTAVPGYFWDRINLKRFGLVEWNKSLERENNNLRQQLADSGSRGQAAG